MKSLIKKVAKIIIRNSLKIKKKKIDELKNRRILSIHKKRRKKILEFRENIINLLGRNIIIIRGVGLFLQ